MWMVLGCERDRALGVGFEEIDRLGVAVERELVEYAVRIIERGRHQVRRLVSRVAEHDTLIAGALVLVAALVDALGDVDRLAMEVTGEIGILPVEAVLLVADPLDRIARGRLALGDGGRDVFAAADLDRRSTRLNSSR